MAIYANCHVSIDFSETNKATTGMQRARQKGIGSPPWLFLLSRGSSSGPSLSRVSRHREREGEGGPVDRAATLAVADCGHVDDGLSGESQWRGTGLRLLDYSAWPVG